MLPSPQIIAGAHLVLGLLIPRLVDPILPQTPKSRLKLETPSTAVQVSVLPWEQNPAWHLSKERVNDLTRSSAQVIDLVWWWKDLEPRLGEYDWQHLDQALETLRSSHKQVKLTLSMYEGNVPAWLGPADGQLDQEGRPVRLQHSYTLPGGFAPSLHNRKALGAYLALVSALVKRYSDRPEIVAWQFAYGWHEIPQFDRRAQAANPLLREKPAPEGFVYDYSPAAQAAWQEHWRSGGGEIAALNQRWRTTFRTWDEVALPKPDYSRTVDARPYWLDHLSFKRESEARIALRLIKAVRANDEKQRPIVFWGISDRRMAAFPNVYGDIAACEVPYYQPWANRIRLQDGLRLYAETGKIPPDPYHVSLTTFNALAYGAQGVLQAGYFQPNRAGSNIFNRLAPHFQELASGEPAEADVALLVSEVSQWATQKSSAMRDMDAALYLGMHNALSGACIPYHALMDTAPMALRQYRLIVDLDNVIHPPAVVKAMEEAVNSGSKLVLMANSGRYDTNGGSNRTLQTLGRMPSGLSDFRSGTLRRINGNLIECFSGPCDADPLVDRIKATVDKAELVRDPQGRALGYRWRHGKGEVLWLLGKPNVSQPALPEARRMVQEWATWSGVRTPVAVSSGVNVATIRRGQEHLFLLFNEAEEYWSFGNRLGMYSPRFPSILPSRVEVYPRLPNGRYQISREGLPLGVWDPENGKGIQLSMERDTFTFLQVVPIK